MGGVRPASRSGYPLTAEKVEGRAAVLRGIGNCIVPAVAAEFIRAYMEAMDVSTA